MYEMLMKRIPGLRDQNSSDHHLWASNRANAVTELTIISCVSSMRDQEKGSSIIVWDSGICSSFVLAIVILIINEAANNYQ